MVGKSAVCAVISIALAACFCMPVPVSSAPKEDEAPRDVSGVYFAHNGANYEHTPSIIQVSNGSYYIAYESTYGGGMKINMTWSPDGVNWISSWAIVDSGSSSVNQHPTLIQRQDGDLQVVYLSDRTGAYRLYTAISTDGLAWTEYGPLGVRNPAINPFIIQVEDGSYAMSYQVYGSTFNLNDGAWFTTSSDGITWGQGVRVCTNSEYHALPRLMKANGGNYMMTYQGGTTGSTFDIRYKTSADGSIWSSETRLTFTGNSHDSFPMQLVNGTYMVLFATATDGQYDLYRKWSANLTAWSTNEHIPTNNMNYDTQPHPVQLSGNQSFLLAWGYDSSALPNHYVDVDIALLWIEDIAAPPAFDIPLSDGWNLISIPLIQANTAVEAALSSIAGDWSVVKYYDGTAKAWKTYRVGSPVNTLTDIDHTMGFWVNADSACTLSISGSQPMTTDIPLNAGWNLVGYPSATSRPASEALLGTDADIVSLWKAESPYVEDRTDLSAITMEPGHGYWVRVPADTTWTVYWD